MKKILFLLLVIFAISIKAQDTAKMDNLKLSNGLYLLNDIPYTGFAAKYYPNGAVSSLYSILNGVKTGKVQVFYDSGKPRVITYEDDKSVNYGETKVWNEDGSVVFEGSWINEKLFRKNESNPYAGQIKVYYINGRINEISEFFNGMWNGTQTLWDRNGKVLSECVFKDNKIINCMQ